MICMPLPVLLVSLCLVCGASAASGVAYPGKAPGKAIAQCTGERVVLRNEILEVAWRIDEQRLSLEEARHTASGGAARVRGGELFAVTLADGGCLKASDFHLAGGPTLTALSADPSAHRLAERFDGWRVAARLTSPDGSLDVAWEAALRDGANYALQRFTFHAGTQDVPVDTLTLLDMHAPHAETAGTTQGAPVVSGGMFFAYEHPMAQSQIDGDHFTCLLHRGQAIEKGGSLVQSAVIGVTPAGQLRRGFLYYVERERAHPFQPFLHYNSWYDIAWADRKFDEAQSLAVIEAFGKELITKRGVRMDSFVFDDGWDDNETLWQFHKGFPNGFRPLYQATQAYGSAVGAWLSPFGGYGEAREQRLKYGKEQGFEINRKGFSLAGARYYERFHGICAEMIHAHGANFFKFDGMGSGGGSLSENADEFLADIEALMRLSGELRELLPHLYISATTGTWCSPYFLWHADSTWRNGSDMGFHGLGTKRQQWITYRDAQTYSNVVQRGPLYPLNSLMTQGIAQGRHGPASELGGDLKEMADEIRSFFASGTGLQELYIAPQLLNDGQWDLLAEGARWSRANADVLVDTHWVGGDPGLGEIYGWASWAPRKGILALRNPGDTAGSIAIDVGKAFELPEGAARSYRLTEPWSADKEPGLSLGKTWDSPVSLGDSLATPGRGPGLALILTGGTPHTFALEAFQVLVYDAWPKGT